MKEKLEQLEKLLHEIAQIIDRRLKIEKTTILEFDNLIRQLEKEYFTIHSEEKRENFNEVKVKMIQDLMGEKTDHSFFDTDIPKLKSLLGDALAKLLNARNNLVMETKFGSKLGEPNKEFIKLIAQNIVSGQSRIMGTFNYKEYYGYLTGEGYFKVEIGENKTKLFSSFSTAASYLCNKTVLKGWKVWSTELENKERKTMEYFKNLIT